MEDIFSTKACNKIATFHYTQWRIYTFMGKKQTEKAARFEKPRQGMEFVQLLQSLGRSCMSHSARELL